MARARNIKPSIFTNEVLGVGNPLLTLLFISLWCLADKEGRLEDRPLRIKANTFPYREGVDADVLLDDLQSQGFIRRYVVGELRLIEVLNFAKHQKPHHTEKESELPVFSSSCHITVNSRCKDALIPDSLNTDSLIPETANAASKPAVDEDPVERRIWKDGIDLLAKSSLTEKQARPLLGRLAKDYGNELLAECIAATQAKNPADPKPFLIAVLKTRSNPNPGALVGKYIPSDDDVTFPDCLMCENRRWVGEWDSRTDCPDCIEHREEIAA